MMTMMKMEKLKKTIEDYDEEGWITIPTDEIKRILEGK
jgi:hypothetical protein